MGYAELEVVTSLYKVKIYMIINAAWNSPQLCFQQVDEAQSTTLQQRNAHATQPDYC